LTGALLAVFLAASGPLLGFGSRRPDSLSGFFVPSSSNVNFFQPMEKSSSPPFLFSVGSEAGFDFLRYCLVNRVGFRGVLTWTSQREGRKSLVSVSSELRSPNWRGCLGCNIRVVKTRLPLRRGRSCPRFSAIRLFVSSPYSTQFFPFLHAR